MRGLFYRVFPRLRGSRHGLRAAAYGSQNQGAGPIPEFPTNVLVFDPRERGDTKIVSLLQTHGMSARVASRFPEFLDALGDDVLFAVMADEALCPNDLTPIHNWVLSQPGWSDLPFIVLTAKGEGPERDLAAARLTEVLGHVFFLERPFHATTFVSAARSAQKNRRRQYEARARMEEMRENELTLKTALLAGRLGTWELDPQTWNLTASDGFKSVFGRGPADTLTYDDLLGSVHPDDRARVRESVLHTLETCEDYLIEYRTVWPDGSPHWAEVRGRVVRSRSGTPSRLVGVASDITERRLEQEWQLRQKEILEERVTESTAELWEVQVTMVAEVAQRERAEEQLRQSQKLEAIGQLTGGVAHDFNNLLMAVMGNLDLLRKHLADDPKALRLIEAALQGARRGASLTQRLLAFARRQELKVEAVDLAALVENMRELLNRSVGGDVEISVRLPKDVSPALADSNQVELALLNLVVNSRDAMPEGGTIRIGLREEPEARPHEDLPAGAYLCLSVTDNGKGMDEETLHRAIEPFFSTKDIGKGTGLGLSMIHGLALQLKGAFVLSSVAGKGTTAELWLPAGSRVVRQVPKVLPEETESAAKPAKILVVDDDLLIAMSTVDMLEDLGHQVMEANSGVQALELIGKDRDIELVITDYSMPGLNGAQLFEAARGLRPDLPFLLATGYADLPPGSGLSLPRLSKPYTQDQLSREIAKILR